MHVCVGVDKRHNFAVVLDDLDQLRCIRRIGGITALFETAGPTLVVLYRYLETGRVTRAFEENRVVLETLCSIAVLTVGQK